MRQTGMVPEGDVMNMPVGSLLAVRNSLDANHWLGLVVNQNVGKVWADRDPCLEYTLAQQSGPLLVRVLGLKLTEGMALDKSSLPKEEPRGTETVRWAYVQTIPAQAYVVAGPDTDSIQTFSQNATLFCRGFGRNGDVTFLRDVSLLVEYLRGVTRTDHETSFYDRKFFAMLREVLPI